MRHTSAKTVKEIQRFLNEGYSAAETSDLTGIARSTIYGLLKRGEVHSNSFKPYRRKWVHTYSVRGQNEPAGKLPPSNNPEDRTVSELPSALVNRFTPASLDLETFVRLLRTLLDDYDHVKKELATLRKSNEEWKIRAGKYLEQAQLAIRDGR